jgi:hypothetical protein
MRPCRSSLTWRAVARTSRITHLLALTPLLAVGVGYQALGLPLALPGFIGQFALGMMLAVLTVKRDCLSATLRRALAALGACSGVAALTVANADGVRDNGGNPAFMLLAATALACGIGLALSSGRARKVLTIGPARSARRDLLRRIPLARAADPDIRAAFPASDVRGPFSPPGVSFCAWRCHSHSSLGFSSNDARCGSRPSRGYRLTPL